MPSGSKKRKAAKKKKQLAANTINSSATNNPHGNEDLKNQVERDNEGGDAGSHSTKAMSVEETTKDAESIKKSELEDIDVKIEKGWEPKNDLESTLVSIQHVEHDKSSSSSNSSSSEKSSRSSSDDESQAFKMKSKEEASYDTLDESTTVLSEEVQKVPENGTFENGGGNSEETVAVDNLVKIELSMPEKTDFSATNSVPDVFDSGLKANEEKLLPSSNVVSEVKLEGAEGKKIPSSDIPTAETSNVAETNQTLDPHEHSEKQPLVASTPPPVQRTSFLSCCGLFEVFTGSGR